MRLLPLKGKGDGISFVGGAWGGAWGGACGGAWGGAWTLYALSSPNKLWAGAYARTLPAVQVCKRSLGRRLCTHPACCSSVRTQSRQAPMHAPCLLFKCANAV
eukprot:363477-Chlamydomonas_euryale.AAC.7